MELLSDRERVNRMVGYRQYKFYGKGEKIFDNLSGLL